MEGGARSGSVCAWDGLLRVGGAQVGLDAGFDWRPLSLIDRSAQEFRALIGPHLTFAADAHEVFFPAAVGYDCMLLEGNCHRAGIRRGVPARPAAALRRGGRGSGGVSPGGHGTGYTDGFTAADV